MSFFAAVLFQSLAGAGGGGYLVAITREPNMGEAIEQALRSTKAPRDQHHQEAVVCKEVNIDKEGLTLTVNGLPINLE